VLMHKINFSPVVCIPCLTQINQESLTRREQSAGWPLPS
jgi:hypothetical protein